MNIINIRNAKEGVLPPSFTKQLPILGVSEMSNYIYHTVYKTTNLVNGKIYIGKHSTNDLNDSYFGSGRLLKDALNKYGKDNFKKEILSTHDTDLLAYSAEEKILTEEFIAGNQNYNLCVGGLGPKSFTKEQKKKLSDIKIGCKLTKEHSANISKSLMGRKRSAKTVNKIKKWHTGRKRPQSTLDKLNASATCLHCGIEAKLNTINRWHGNNCKAKKC